MLSFQRKNVSLQSEKLYPKPWDTHPRLRNIYPKLGNISTKLRDRTFSVIEEQIIRE